MLYTGVDHIEYATKKASVIKKKRGHFAISRTKFRNQYS